MSCLFYKRSCTEEGFLHPIDQESQSFKIFHVLHFGPFPKTKKRIEYVLRCFDEFTKFAFLKAVKSTETDLVVNCFKDIFAT